MVQILFIKADRDIQLLGHIQNIYIMPDPTSGLLDVRRIGVIDHHKVNLAADIDCGFGTGIEDE